MGPTLNDARLYDWAWWLVAGAPGMVHGSLGANKSILTDFQDVAVLWSMLSA